MPTVKGPFTVKMTPAEVAKADGRRARFLLDKTYEGPLTGTAVGEMLSGGDPRTGSAGYVAIENVIGTLDGKTGSFILQHSSTLDAGTPTQSITVIPGSGTEALAGLRGSLVIDNDNGAHSYTFTYELP